jgi:hypothetical protein
MLIRVEGLIGQFVSQVACGYTHTVVLTSDGCLWTFWSQQWPEKVEGVFGRSTSKKVVFIAAGHMHSACITEDGSTYTWGRGIYGRLGHGDETDRFSPNLVNGLVGIKAKEAALGGSHTLIRTEDGRVYSFGDGSNGQLGHGDKEDRLTPTLIGAPLEGKFVVQVACGRNHSMALTREGSVYTWGYGANGRLGHGSEVDYTFPCIVEALYGKKVVKISSYNAHSVALVGSEQQESYASKMKAMINDESCSDVVFVLEDGDDRVYANKGLLIGQSEYFRAMFRSNMRESRENEVKVEGCSKDSFLLLLEYLYIGAVDVGMDHALELYVLADRYQVNGLSRQCLKVIGEGLTNENAIRMLVEVDGLGLDALRDVCMSFAISNYDKVMDEATHESLSPDLRGEELMMRFFQRNQNK